MLDPEIIEWTEQYGSVTTFSFMIYGPFTEKDTTLLSHGLNLHLASQDEMFPMMAFVNEIDEDEARLMGTFQGVNLYIVLPENRLYLEAFVIEVVQDGLSFLRLKHEYLGTREASNLV